MPVNTEIARLLHELAALTELEDASPNSFRARAYHNAVRAIETHPRDVTALSEEELEAIKGVGRSTARKIREYAETGHIAKLEQLRRKYPPGYLDLVRVPGLGPKKVVLLREHLGITTLQDLEAAIAEGRLRDVPGLGEKTEENLAKSIQRLGLAGKQQRTPIADALVLAEHVVATLRAVPGVLRVAYAGSLRRFRDTVADIDVLAASHEPVPVMEAFTRLAMAREVIVRGDKKSSVRLTGGLQVDLRVVEPSQWGAAMLYFTGSKAHNVHVRELAVRRGLTLNEYGLFEAETGRLIASESEEDIYAALGMQWIPPGMREDCGEVEAALADALPPLATPSDVIGDLHVHTDLSGDGHVSLDEMVEAAVARGCRYVAITDHGEDLRINGASREAMLAQRAHLQRLRQRYPEVSLLHGCELNIGPEGSLDYDDEFLAGFDWCVASVHSHFRLERAEQTARLLRAMRHPAVSAIGHLQGRRIGRRPGIDIDVDAVLTAAAQTGTAIEINCHLDRLDATADVLRAARGRDVAFVIDTDAHRLHELAYVVNGVRQAERGWVPAERIANTWPPERFLEFVRAKRHGTSS